MPRRGRDGRVRFRVALLGCGRAGSAVAAAAARAGHPVVAVWNRTPERARSLAALLGVPAVEQPAAAVRDADLTIVAVADRAVTPLAEQLAEGGVWQAGTVVIHLSGALGPDALAPARKAGAAVAACHPLVSIADPAMIHWRGVRFLVAGDPQACARADALVRDLGGVPVYGVGGPGRPAYHAAAALVANMPVAVVGLAAAVLAGVGYPRDQIRPALAVLLRSVAENVEAAGPVRALTGPIARADADTVARHLEALKSWPLALDAYRACARATLELARAGGLDAEAAGLILRLLEEVDADA